MFDNPLCLYPLISRACICRCRLTKNQTVVLFEVLFTIQLNRKGRNKLINPPKKYDRFDANKKSRMSTNSNLMTKDVRKIYVCKKKVSS